MHATVWTHLKSAAVQVSAGPRSGHVKFRDREHCPTVMESRALRAWIRTRKAVRGLSGTTEVLSVDRSSGDMRTCITQKPPSCTLIWEFKFCLKETVTVNIHG